MLALHARGESSVRGPTSQKPFIYLNTIQANKRSQKETKKQIGNENHALINITFYLIFSQFFFVSFALINITFINFLSSSSSSVLFLRVLQERKKRSFGFSLFSSLSLYLSSVFCIVEFLALLSHVGMSAKGKSTVTERERI